MQNRQQDKNQNDHVLLLHIRESKNYQEATDAGRILFHCHVNSTFTPWSVSLTEPAFLPIFPIPRFTAHVCHGENLHLIIPDPKNQAVTKFANFKLTKIFLKTPNLNQWTPRPAETFCKCHFKQLGFFGIIRFDVVYLIKKLGSCLRMKSVSSHSYSDRTKLTHHRFSIDKFYLPLINFIGAGRNLHHPVPLKRLVSAGITSSTNDCRSSALSCLYFSASS